MSAASRSPGARSRARGTAVGGAAEPTGSRPSSMVPSPAMGAEREAQACAEFYGALGIAEPVLSCLQCLRQFAG